MAHDGSDAEIDPLHEFLETDEAALYAQPFLDALEAQAEAADRTRSVAADVVEAIRGTDFMRMSATRSIGGVEQSMLHMGRELEAIAARCPSTAWCLWNHLCVFHLFVGSLGPGQLHACPGDARHAGGVRGKLQADAHQRGIAI